jgi:PKD repeat protein
LKIELLILTLGILVISSIVLAPLTQGGCIGDWPYCCNGCTAKDVTITYIFMVSDTSCTPGSISTATLYGIFDNPSNGPRYCFHSAMKVYNVVTSNYDLIEYNLGQQPLAQGRYTAPIATVQYICGESLEAIDVHADWLTSLGNNEICAYNNCGDYIPAKCYDNAGPIIVYPPLITDFLYDNVCAKAPYQFTDKTTGGLKPYYYSWNFGDNTSPATTQNPIHTYNTPGLYNVCLTVTDSQPIAMTDTKCHIIKVWPPKPEISITATIV